MKEKIISLLIECDMHNGMVLSDKSMAPSSSIEEIAEYISSSITRQQGVSARFLIPKRTSSATTISVSDV